MDTDRPRVTVTVSGLTGTGKSRIIAEIEVALKAAGVPVEFATKSDAAGARDEHWALAQTNGPVVEEWPLVILAERNEPRT